MNSLRRSIINPRFPWCSHLDSLDFPWSNMHLAWAQKLKSDTLQAWSSNLELSLTVMHCRRDEHIQISGLKFMQLVGRPLWVIRRESKVDILSLFPSLVLIRVTWKKFLGVNGDLWLRKLRQLTFRTTKTRYQPITAITATNPTD